MHLRRKTNALKKNSSTPQVRNTATSPFGSPGLNCKDVLCKEKIVDFPSYTPPKTPIFSTAPDFEVDIEIDQYQQLATQSLAYISKELNRDDKNLEGLYILLKDLKFFKKHSPKIVKELVRIGKYEKFPKDSILLQEGEPGIYVYIIISGSVAITKFSSGENIVIASAYDGDIIGEYSFIRKIIHHTPSFRSASCITTEESHLIKIFNTEISEAIEKFSDLNNDHLAFIRKLDPFKHITPIDLALLSNTITAKRFEMNECVIKAGECPKCVYFVYRGRVKIRYPARKMHYSKLLKAVKHSKISKEIAFGSGKFFGQRILQGRNIPVNFSILADNSCFTTLLLIYKEDFEQLFKPVQEHILKYLSEAQEFDLKVPEDYTYL